MMDIHLNCAALLAAALLLAGCVSDLDHSTIAVAALGPGSPRTISGETLRECVADSGVLVPTGDTGTFDTAYSGHFAESVFYQGGGVDVSSLRTYSVPFVSTNIFGTKKDRSLACLYDFRDGKLIYLSHLNVDSEGKVDLEDVQRAGKATYLKLKDAGRARRVTAKAGQ